MSTDNFISSQSIARVVSLFLVAPASLALSWPDSPPRPLRPVNKFPRPGISPNTQQSGTENWNVRGRLEAKKGEAQEKCAVWASVWVIYIHIYAEAFASGPGYPPAPLDGRTVLLRGEGGEGLGMGVGRGCMESEAHPQPCC